MVRIEDREAQLRNVREEQACWGSVIAANADSASALPLSTRKHSRGRACGAA
jgi:hypothetical protein